VFLVAVPVALVGLAVVLFLREVPLRGPGGPVAKAPAEKPATPAARPATVEATR